MSFLLWLLIAVTGNTATFDAVLRGALVVDGSGGPGRKADVGLKGDRIAKVGTIPPGQGREWDLTGLVLAPGFVDMLGQSDFSLLVDPRAASTLLMGVTTEISGEGNSAAPLDDRMVREKQEAYAPLGLTIDWKTFPQYLARLDRAGIGINFGSYIGATNLRKIHVGWDNVSATPAQLKAMAQDVTDAIRAGAFGVSSALQYTPGRFADTAEMVELAKAAGAMGAIYATHQRSEGDQWESSLAEVFDIARRAGVQTEIFHLKTAYAKNWGKMPQVVARIEKARAQGLRVSANIYPYAAAASGLTACLPPWLLEGGMEKTLERLNVAELRARAAAEIQKRAHGWENFYTGSGGAEGILLSQIHDPGLSVWEGKRLSELSKAQRKSPVDALLDLIIADRGRTTAVFFLMAEKDVRKALKTPWVTFGTDSGARALDGPLKDDRGHPRAWGSFARVLGRYVREEKLVKLESAIARMTSVPAERMGLIKRGLVREGNYADLVAFNAQTIRDRSTFEQPQAYAEGVQFVWVNGRPAVEKGKLTAERAGRVLRFAPAQ